MSLTISATDNMNPVTGAKVTATGWSGTVTVYTQPAGTGSLWSAAGTLVNGELTILLAAGAWWLYASDTTNQVAPPILIAVTDGLPVTAMVPVTGGPVRLERRAHVRSDGVTVFSDDVAIRVAVPGSGLLASTFGFEVYTEADSPLTSGLAITITDPANRVVTATITGQSLTPQTYRWTAFRTDTGNRLEVAYGFLVVHDARRG